jgi:hypothetical protein
MLGHLTHLGDTSQQHAPLVLWRNPVPTRAQHNPWLVFYNHRGWIVLKQSILLPGSPLEAIPAAFHFGPYLSRRRAVDRKHMAGEIE